MYQLQELHTINNGNGLLLSIDDTNLKMIQIDDTIPTWATYIRFSPQTSAPPVPT